MPVSWATHSGQYWAMSWPKPILTLVRLDGAGLAAAWLAAGFAEALAAAAGFDAGLAADAGAVLGEAAGAAAPPQPASSRTSGRVSLNADMTHHLSLQIR